VFTAAELLVGKLFRNTILYALRLPRFNILLLLCCKSQHIVVAFCRVQNFAFVELNETKGSVELFSLFVSLLVMSVPVR